MIKRPTDSSKQIRGDCEERFYFISREPLSGAGFSQGTNLYAYIDNNYLKLNDLTGESGNPSYNELAAIAASEPASAKERNLSDNIAGAASDMASAFADAEDGDFNTTMSDVNGALGDVETALPSPQSITTAQNSLAQAANSYPPPEGPAAAEAITGGGQMLSVVSAMGQTAKENSEKDALRSDQDRAK